MDVEEVQIPADEAPPAQKMNSSLDLCIDMNYNFILGATYEQEDLPVSARHLPLPGVLAYCESRAGQRGAVGFFYQQHTNGHEIVGFYLSVEAMQGCRVRHGHARGFLACPPPVSTLFNVDTASNFIVGAQYDQEVLPETAMGQVLAATLLYCEKRAQKRGAAGFFYQMHENGHEIVGFYESDEAMACGDGAAWHGHARGLLASRKAAVVGTLVLDGIPIKLVQHGTK